MPVDHTERGEQASKSEGISLRSRASSVVSTGTKFSVSTIPLGNHHIDGVLDSHVARSTATRPASVYSVRSMAPSLPPYESHLDSSHTSSLQFTSLQTAVAGTDPEQPPTPSTFDAENALSIHYGRVVRTIDENHARQLARLYEAHDQQLRAHEQELAATRDAVDQVYRKEFKAKDRQVERVREEAAASVAAIEREMEKVRNEASADISALEAEIRVQSMAHEETIASMQQDAIDQVVSLHDEYQAAIDKARNAIEDLWEGRWNDRLRL